MGITKSRLAILLSQLKGFDGPNIRQEQYITEPEIAAEVLWFAYMQGDIEGKVSADLGCGTGILGLGMTLLGTRQCIMVEDDKKAIDIARENVAFLGQKGYQIRKGIILINKDISEFKENVEVVIQNPPFGTKKEHADKLFLEKAFTCSNRVYSFHKTSTEKFVRAMASDNGFKITHKLDFKFPLKQTASFHKKKIKYIDVTCFRMKK
jgi:putative methylase